MSECLLGYRVYGSETDLGVQDVCEHIASGRGVKFLSCLNPHSYAIAKNNEVFRAALQGSSWLVADGIGIVLASVLLGGRVRERTTGFDVFSGVSESLNQGPGARVFFLGSTQETLDKIAERYARDYPRLAIGGTYSPPFRAKFSREENDAMVAAINGASADVLWVGLTSPKQDIWMFDNRDRLNVRFAAGIGAVFDFYAGNIRRSHPAFQRLGLEWLPRLVQEPRRLWRRMFVSAPIFVGDVGLACAQRLWRRIREGEGG